MLTQTKFCSIPNLVIVNNFILNEQTIDYYLCNFNFLGKLLILLAIYEAMINKLIPYISKINDNKDFMTSGLLLEELNVKDFEKQRVYIILLEIVNYFRLKFLILRTSLLQRKVQ